MGEDGPTHQPIEQEMQVRLLESLKNHSGKNSMLVLRPADVEETTVAWKMALENIDSPTGLILSRQNIKNIPRSANPYQEATQVEKGAYIVKKAKSTPDVVLLASGSEVATLFEAAQLLETRKELAIQIVSAPSEGLYMNQDASYKESVIPSSTPVFGLTAGLSITLQNLVGYNGRVFGLNHFGYSAPFNVLDEKFGFTPENVYKQVCEYLHIQP